MSHPDCVPLCWGLEAKHRPAFVAWPWSLANDWGQKSCVDGLTKMPLAAWSVCVFVNHLVLMFVGWFYHIKIWGWRVDKFLNLALHEGVYFFILLSFLLQFVLSPRATGPCFLPWIHFSASLSILGILLLSFLTICNFGHWPHFRTECFAKLLFVYCVK